MSSIATLQAPSSMAHSHSHSHLNHANSMASSSSSNVGVVINRPAVIEFGHYRFLVHDAPTDSNLSSYLEYMKRKKVVTLVRACEPTYDKAPLEGAGIKVVELPFQDGLAPPDAMISAWLALVSQTFDEEKKSKKDKKDAAPQVAVANGKSSSSGKAGSDIKCAIAVHCVAGLGRAPVLVCIALIENGMGWMEAVELVRKKRRGALNLTQLKYLETYKVRGKNKDSCNIM